MPDITMCKDAACPQREACYRFTAKPSKFRQSYFLGTPRKPDDTCDHFSPIDGSSAGAADRSEV